MQRRHVILIAVAVLAVVALIVVGSGVSTYNKLVTERQAVQTQSKQVDVEYQAMFGLLPQLTSLAEGALKNETAFVKDVTGLRQGACAPSVTDGNLTASDNCASAMFQLVQEKYPQLNSLELYANVQTVTVDSFNKVSYAKRTYNELAGDYNAHIQRCCIPSYVARHYGFEKAELIGYSDRPNQSSFGTNTL